MLRLAYVGTALAAAAITTAALATEDPIATRKALMQSNGSSAKEGSNMVKGDMPFHVDAATAVLRNFRAVGYTFGDYFPEGSQNGETRASPKIWEDMAGFQAAVAKFRTDAEAALNSKPATPEAFQAAFQTVSQNCQSCHETYRTD